MNTTSSRKTWGALLFLAAAIALIAGVFLARFAFTPLRSGASETLVIEIRKGDSPAQITRTLIAQGVIEDATMFSWLGRISRAWKGVKAGEYLVSPSMTPLEVFRSITSGRSVNYPLTVREGENMFEIGAKLQTRGLGTQNRFVELCRDPKLIAGLGFEPPFPLSLEGYLYPETYFIQRSHTMEDVIRMMVKRFSRVWKEFDGKQRALGLTRHEIVTLASMIEKETGAPQERPMISSVFHNRLRKRMRLQSDPTTIYGIWEKYDGNIRKSDLLTPTPYNTYTVAALPIGPIANPGREALAAALEPAVSDSLFFVSKNDGTHEFNATYEGHEMAVTRLQRNPKAREGKSWRDLKTKTD